MQLQSTPAEYEHLTRYDKPWHRNERGNGSSLYFTTAIEK